MQLLIKRILIIGFGWAFIFLGIIGLFLPILQGILFLLIGLGLLSTDSRTARMILIKLRRRFPGLSRKLKQAEKRARRIFARVGENKGSM